MTTRPAPLDRVLVVCLFAGLGAFLVHAAVVQCWYPLVTPWRAMGLLGALVGVVVAAWVRARGGATIRAPHLGAAWLAAFVAAALLAEPMLAAANGLFDRSTPTPRVVRVLRAAARGSTVRIERTSGPIDVILPIDVGRVRDGDAFLLDVGEGALGLPWCRLDAIHTPRD